MVRRGKLDSGALVVSETKKKTEKNDKKKKNGKFEERSRATSRNVLVKYEALPSYLKDNEFIRDYYRCEWPFKDIVFSIFAWHNETLNIWTHLIGFVIFAALTAVSVTETVTLENLVARLSFTRPVAEGPLMGRTNGSDSIFPDWYTGQIPKPNVNGDFDVVPKWPWFVFLAGAMCCLVFSALSHTFACHSKPFNLFFWRLDYSGIAIMIVCSFIAPIYYAFSCLPGWAQFYLTTIALVGICVIFTLMSPRLSTGRYRSFRAKLFLAMGFSGIIPAAHGVVLYLDHPMILVALGYEVTMGLLYALGATFYVTRVPEKWRPGAYDIVGHSHQIFHIFVVAAALTHSVATLIIMDWRRGLPPCGSWT